jgi:hypothetical protein
MVQRKKQKRIAELTEKKTSTTAIIMKGAKSALFAGTQRARRGKNCCEAESHERVKATAVSKKLVGSSF